MEKIDEKGRKQVHSGKRLTGREIEKERDRQRE